MKYVFNGFFKFFLHPLHDMRNYKCLKSENIRSRSFNKCLHSNKTDLTIEVLGQNTLKLPL